MTLYLLCIAPPYHHASHYLGFTAAETAEGRFDEHLSGRGSPLIRAAVQAGHSVSLVKQWPGSRKDERAIKNQKRASGRLCPRCRGAHLERERVRMAKRRAGIKKTAQSVAATHSE